jgi:cytochrome b6-f complex iron-sulfur subunit
MRASRTAIRAGSVTQDLQAGIYIVHGPEGIYALSAVCTHLGCLTAWKPNWASSPAPAMAASSASTGRQNRGPRAAPLPWLRAWIGDEGELLVDRASVIPPKQYVRT